MLRIQAFAQSQFNADAPPPPPRPSPPLLQATGSGKADMIHGIFEGGADYPAGRVAVDEGGELRWFIDQPAGAKLAPPSVTPFP